jgi:hypothetical protein
MQDQPFRATCHDLLLHCCLKQATVAVSLVAYPMSRRSLYRETLSETSTGNLYARGGFSTPQRGQAGAKRPSLETQIRRKRI